MGHISCFLHDQKGIASIEYALLLAFIGVVIGIAMALLGAAVTGRIDAMAEEISK